MPGSERFPGEGNGNLLLYSCLENPMDGGVWWAIVHGVQKARQDLATKQQQFLLCISSIAVHFVEDCRLYIHKDYSSGCFFSCDVFLSFWYQDNTGLIKWDGK